MGQKEGEVKQASHLYYKFPARFQFKTKANTCGQAMIKIVNHFFHNYYTAPCQHFNYKLRAESKTTIKPLTSLQIITPQLNVLSTCKLKKINDYK